LVDFPASPVTGRSHVSTIKPYFGEVILTDKGGPYPDASDHNAIKAKLHLDTLGTNATVLTFNVRRYPFDLGTPYDWDKYRDHRAAQLIADSAASVVALQECEPEQDAYLLKKLPELTGVPWQAVSAPTNVGLMFKADRWRLLGWRFWLMDNGAENDRRLVLAALQSVKTGEIFWFGSTHFGVNFIGEAGWRRYQAEQAVMHLKNVLPSPADKLRLPVGDVRQRSVIMGDFNDSPPVTEPGVRRVFGQAGFYELRDRLTDAEMHGDSFATHHAFGKPTPRNGSQIDIVFTPK